jgi:hypothetical protein
MDYWNTVSKQLNCPPFAEVTEQDHYFGTQVTFALKM